MPSQDLNLHLENQTLRTEFTRRGLDLSQVWRPTPDDPERENRQLRYLLDWVEKYESCPSRERRSGRGEVEVGEVEPG